ncbi:aldehyde dehydrogenase family protein [Bacterioplanoides sp.]|uniref:aldehyde dehydrogenase family protein n=1 Tax=Bacterioplanoides sp. TaxID=2066072 RepID=UPI003B5C7340
MSISALSAATSDENHATSLMSRARQAEKQLAASSLKQRLKILAQVQQNILALREEIVASLVDECGKTKTDANIEIIGVLDWLKWLQDHAEKFLNDKKVPTPITLLGKQSRIWHQPLGTVLIIAPWNYPFHIGITQIFTAFACANAVLYKPSEITPMRGIYERVLAVDSLLQESVVIAYGNGQLGADLIDQRPDKIFFTGSTRTGKAISRQAADYLVPVDLELGGKDPMIVMDSADIKRAAAAAVWGANTHNGQSCSAVERLYVQSGIYKKLLAEIKHQTQQLIQKEQDKNGDTDLSRVTVDFQFDIIRDHIEDAVNKGATLVCGGDIVDAEKLMLQPTVLTDVSDQMKCISQETFGPLLPVIPFDTEQQVIELANNNEFGLQASVFSADINQAQRIARQLQVGGVSINNVNMVEGNPWLSFGGRKNSGTGRARGVEGLLAFSQSKHVLIDKNSSQIEANWYPYTQEKYQLVIQFFNALFEKSPLRLTKAAMAGLKLEKISQNQRTKARKYNAR